MTFEVIDSPEPNFPVNIFTPNEDTVGVNDSNGLVTNCCGYQAYPHLIDSIWETDVDE